MRRRRWQARPNPFRPSQLERRPNRATRRMLAFAPFRYACPCGHGSLIASMYWMGVHWKSLAAVRCSGCGGSSGQFVLQGGGPVVISDLPPGYSSILNFVPPPRRRLSEWPAHGEPANDAR
jgi:hypothetical protein